MTGGNLRPQPIVVSWLLQSMVPKRTDQAIVSTDEGAKRASTSSCPTFRHILNSVSELKFVSRSALSRYCSCICAQRQAAAVLRFLSFFRLGVLAFEVPKRYVQRLVAEADSQALT